MTDSLFILLNLYKFILKHVAILAQVRVLPAAPAVGGPVPCWGMWRSRTRAMVLPVVEAFRINSMRKILGLNARRLRFF